MIKRIVTITVVSLMVPSVLSAQTEAKRLLRDGFVLSGVDGKLVARGQKWFFEFERAVSDGINVIEAGRKLEMLTSAGLEKMIADLKEKPGTGYRLFNAVVTKYKGQNFIFCDYFLPVTEVKQEVPKQGEIGEDEKKTEVVINEPNDAVVIPQEIVDKLQGRRIIRPERMKGKFELKQDSILANRTGFIIRKEDGTHELVFDGLGRNMARVSLDLLACKVLERVERKQSTDPERRLYRVSGVVTKYNERYYLLLQQAIRSYGYGNFGT